MTSLVDALAEACREDLGIFARKAFSLLEPGREYTESWHVDCVCEHLAAVEAGQIQRLIINIPPRTLKSVLVAQVFPVWVLARQRHAQFIGVSYAHTLAERNVMGARKLVQSDFYRSAYPYVSISSDNNRKDFFTTTLGGQYKGTGIGGTVTGFGADYLLIDDPVNPQEAMSDTIRQSTNSEIRSTLFSRFNDFDKGRLVMIMQRLHEADPTGELLALGGYHHLKLPAEAVRPVRISLGGKSWSMEPGELLTPRLPRSALDELRLSLGEYNFSGQYQQEPVPLGGGEFKGGWLHHYDTAPSVRRMNLVILCDPSGGEETNKRKRKLSDWTAYMVVGLAPDNNYYVLDIVRDRLNPTDRVEMLFLLHRKWNAASGKPPKVGYEKYGMMTDTHYIRTKQEADGYHFPLIELGGPMQKEERIRRMIPDMQCGRWYFPRRVDYVDGAGRKFDLVKEFIDSEMATFPKSKYDDMMDCLSRVYDQDLNLVFPAIEVSMVERARRDVVEDTGGGWRDY